MCSLKKNITHSTFLKRGYNSAANVSILIFFALFFFCIYHGRQVFLYVVKVNYELFLSIEWVRKDIPSEWDSCIVIINSLNPQCSESWLLLLIVHIPGFNLHFVQYLTSKLDHCKTKKLSDFRFFYLFCIKEMWVYLQSKSIFSWNRLQKANTLASAFQSQITLQWHTPTF